MSAIEALIRVKKQATSDDLLIFLDELILYEKLSKSKAFQDLKTSTVAQKKLPMLSRAYTGDLYCLSLCEMMRNILIHLEGHAPDVIVLPLRGLKEKDLKKLKILQKSVIDVSYRALIDYDHEIWKDQVVGVFTTDVEGTDTIAILIVVKNEGAYIIYQGFYGKNEIIEESKEFKAGIYKYARENDSLEISTYSIQGNNAYPFGIFRRDSKEYSVMIPWHHVMWLTDIKQDERIRLNLTAEQINNLNMSKLDIKNFSKCVFDIIRKGLKHEEIKRDTGEGVENDRSGDEGTEPGAGCDDDV